MAAAWWAISECRMQFPRRSIASHIRIGGIATFVDAVESSLSRIACETAPRMCARRTRGPDSPPPDRWAAYPRAPARTRARSCVPGQRRPRVFREVDVRIKGVNVHVRGFACELHARPGAVVPRSQTTSPTTPDCQRFSPSWSALWAPHCPEPRPHQPKPRPRSQTTGELRCERCTVELGPRRGRQQTGGIAALEPRHADDTPKQGS